MREADCVGYGSICVVVDVSVVSSGGVGSSPFTFPSLGWEGGEGAFLRDEVGVRGSEAMLAKALANNVRLTGSCFVGVAILLGFHW